MTWPPLTCDSSPAVFPEYFRMTSLETLPLTFDASALVDADQNINSAVAQLIQLNVGVDYAAGRYGPVQINGTDLTQIVTALVPRQRYRLVIQFTSDGLTVWAPYLIVECVA